MQQSECPWAGEIESVFVVLRFPSLPAFLKTELQEEIVVF